MGIYFRDILLIRISRGANNCGQHSLAKNIYFIMRFSPHFQLFYFNDWLEFCEFIEWKIKRINNADLFSQPPLLIFIKGANISGGHCTSITTSFHPMVSLTFHFQFHIFDMMHSIWEQHRSSKWCQTWCKVLADSFWNSIWKSMWFKMRTLNNNLNSSHFRTGPEINFSIKCWYLSSEIDLKDYLYNYLILHAVRTINNKVVFGKTSFSGYSWELIWICLLLFTH